MGRATYGSKTMNLRIGRKTYSIEAIIAAVPSPIFGWDIFDKYKLSLDWNENEELIIRDKKAQIQSVLKHEVVDPSFIPKVQEIASSEDECTYFEVQCMKKLDAFVNSISVDENEEESFVDTNLPLGPEVDPDHGEDEKKNWEALKKIDKKWADLIRKFPEILKPQFKAEPKHQVLHKIDTGDSSPVTTKVRPLLASSEKSLQGKKIW